jgi:hypothetical protein
MLRSVLFVKVPKRPCPIFILIVTWQEFYGGPHLGLLTLLFSLLGLFRIGFDLAIIYPVDWLAIPKEEVRRFQLFAALTLDLIWFSRNKLFHEALQLV